MGRLTWPIVFLSDDLDTHKDWDMPHQIMVTLVGREEENLGQWGVCTIYFIQLKTLEVTSLSNCEHNFRVINKQEQKISPKQGKEVSDWNHDIYMQFILSMNVKTIERLLRDYRETIERLLRDCWETVERLLRDYWETIERLSRNYHNGELVS